MPTLKRVLAAAVYFLGLLAFGFSMGGLIGGRVIGRSQMGVDQLADALGGMGIGMAAAVVFGIWTVPRLTVRRRVMAGCTLWGLAAVAILILRATRP